MSTTLDALLAALPEGDRARLRAGDAVDAVDVLHEQVRTDPDDQDRLLTLRDVRILAGIERKRGASRPRPVPDSPADVELALSDDGLPVVAADELDLRTLLAALERVGCLLVKGVVSEPRAAELRQMLDRVLDLAATHKPPASQWLSGPSRIEGQAVSPVGRMWTRKEGGSLTIDSPRLLHEVLSDYRRAGVVSVAEEFVGARPALAAEKCYLRRFPGKGLLDNSWHQDGQFIGTPRVLNAWLTFDACGREAPGMELLLRPVPEVYDPEPDADFDWSLTDRQVRALETEAYPIVVPAFDVGDCLLFDHLLVHRTFRSAAMTKQRMSAETWFFAPTELREDYTPILV